MTCAIEGCEGRVNARGWCHMHYARWMRGGDPNYLVSRRSLADRFWAKVERGGPDECWPWRGAQNGKGYGWFTIAKPRATCAHRFAVELDGRSIPEGYDVDHLCFNRSCVNPAHLEPVTRAENLRRMRERACRCN